MKRVDHSFSRIPFAHKSKFFMKSSYVSFLPLLISKKDLVKVMAIIPESMIDKREDAIPM